MVHDPNKPKGRTSAYAFFVLSFRDEYKEKNQSPPGNLALFFKTCSDQWKVMSVSEKKKFEDMARADQARYEAEMKNYVPPKTSGKKVRKKKDPNAPRQPLSAFFIFCGENRVAVKKEYPHFSISEIAKKLVEMWSKLSVKERSPFEQKALKLRERQEGGSATKTLQDPEDDEDEDEDEEEDEDEDDDDDDDDDE